MSRTVFLAFGVLFWLSYVVPAAHCDDPPSPHWETLFPSGARQGSTCILTIVGGHFDSWPVATWTDGPDLSLRALEGQDKKQDNDPSETEPETTKQPEVRQLEITVQPDARPGVRWLRLHDDSGVTSLRPFIVGTLPEVQEQEPNDSIAEPQKLDTSTVVVNGRLEKKADTDTFAIQLQRGQTLVAHLVANEILRSPMDGILQVSSTDGAILGQNHDSRGADPRLVFTAPSTDTFIVQCFAFPERASWNIAFDGGENYVYRLTLTTQGFVDHLYPPICDASQPTQVEPVGWNIPAGARRLQTAQLSPLEADEIFHSDLGNTALLRWVSFPVFVEPQDSQGRQPLICQPPCWVSGVIAEPEETDVYEFDLEKGKTVSFRVDARDAGSPLDAVLTFHDANGKQMERNDDVKQSRDSALAYGIKEEGRYRLEIFDLHRRGGKRYVYTIKASQGDPDFELTLGEKLFTIQAGGTIEIPVEVKRIDGFDGVIEVTATSLPPGVTATTALSEGKGDSAGKVTLKLTATSEEPRSSGAFRVVGTTTEPRALTREVRSEFRRLLPPVPHLWLTVHAEEEKPPASD